MWKSRRLDLRRDPLRAVGFAGMTGQRRAPADRLELAALGSIAVAAGALGLKLAAYWLTG